MAENNPLKKIIPKRPKIREYEGCSPLQRYETLEKIGEGTFGVVHKARHRKTKELVALKRILMHNEKDGFPITALREIKILKMLSHPNVIRLSDMTVERGDKSKKKRGSIYMVTPYMDHDLCGLLDNPKVEFTTPQIKCYMKQLLEGTRYLHSMHILHRDMKAANLLISNKGILQIADFGLARMFYDDPPPGSNEPRREYTNMVVTRWYRPPELLLGERRYTPAIDLWGLGCILAEMYKGKPILQGQSDIDQLNKIFQLCGTPTEATMPGWTMLPGCEGIRSFKSFPSKLDEEYVEHGKDMVSLLSSLLKLDPQQRATASEALQHDYFVNDPLPASPDDLPNYEASHEFDKRKHAAERHDALPPRAPDAAGQMVAGNQNSHAMAPRDSTLPNTAGRDDSRRRDGGGSFNSEHSRRPIAGRNDRDRSRDYSSRYDDRPSWRDDRDYRSRHHDRDSYTSNRRSPRRDISRDGRDHRHTARDYYDDRPTRRYDRDARDRRDDWDRRDDRDRRERRPSIEARDPRDTTQRSTTRPTNKSRSRSRSRTRSEGTSTK